MNNSKLVCKTYEDYAVHIWMMLDDKAEQFSSRPLVIWMSTAKQDAGPVATKGSPRCRSCGPLSRFAKRSARIGSTQHLWPTASGVSRDEEENSKPSDPDVPLPREAGHHGQADRQRSHHPRAFAKT